MNLYKRRSVEYHKIEKDIGDVQVDIGLDNELYFHLKFGRGGGKMILSFRIIYFKCFLVFVTTKVDLLPNVEKLLSANHI